MLKVFNHLKRQQTGSGIMDNEMEWISQASRAGVKWKNKDVLKKKKKEIKGLDAAVWLEH